MMSLNFNPTTALVHVGVSNADSITDSLPILLNPTGLSTLGRAVIGKLSPIGWSQNVLQYGHSESTPLKLEFYFSAELLRRRDQTAVLNLSYYVQWFTSYTLPRALGVAPRKLLIVWPNVLSMVLAVEEVSTEYTRFTRRLEPKEVRIHVSGIELRKTFRSAGDMRTYGYDNLQETKSKASSGASLNLGVDDVLERKINADSPPDSDITAALRK